VGEVIGLALGDCVVWRLVRALLWSVNEGLENSQVVSVGKWEPLSAEVLSMGWGGRGVQSFCGDLCVIEAIFGDRTSVSCVCGFGWVPMSVGHALAQARLSHSDFC